MAISQLNEGIRWGDVERSNILLRVGIYYIVMYCSQTKVNNKDRLLGMVRRFVYTFKCMYRLNINLLANNADVKYYDYSFDQSDIRLISLLSYKYHSAFEFDQTRVFYFPLNQTKELFLLWSRLA